MMLWNHNLKNRYAGQNSNKKEQSMKSNEIHCWNKLFFERNELVNI